MSAKNSTVAKRHRKWASVDPIRRHQDRVAAIDHEKHGAPRVLIVDDDPALLLLMSETLKRAGFTVAQAADGAQAIGRCREFQPDVVLLDIEMPEMDGFSACANIRRDAHSRDLPIVMVTGFDDAVSIHRAFKAGATDFISKPINWPLFEHRVRAILAARETSAELEAKCQTISSLKRVAPDVALIVTRNGKILEHLGHPVTDGNPYPTGTMASLEDLWSAEIVRAMRQRISRVLKTRQSVSYEFGLRDETGSRYYEGRFLIDGRERVLLVVQEVTAHKTPQTEIYKLAYYDPVTCLPNRHLFEKGAEACLTEARLRERGLAFLYLTFNALDQINTELGRAGKEEALRKVADRLVRSLREADCLARLDEDPAAIGVARLSGNQFVVLLIDIHSHDHAASVADRIPAAFDDRMTCENHQVDITPCMGISLFPQDGQDVATLMKAAQGAMQEASLAGDDAVRFASETAPVDALVQLDLATELRCAIEQDQLQLYYQPKINVDTGDIVGAEALLRWLRPPRGFVPLNELLALAETTGLIVRLGDWVLYTACKQAATWHKLGLPPLHVSVNLSHQEFSRCDLLERVTEILGKTGMDPRYLEFELTEQTLMRAQHAVSELKKLKELGISLALDDFGTGYSSLAHLKHYAIDALKIDYTFVHGVPGNAEDVAVCEVIINMAHTLGLKAVAEGVETTAQLEFLRGLGCDEIQGFLVSEPLPPQELELYLSQGQNREREP